MWAGDSLNPLTVGDISNRGGTGSAGQSEDKKWVLPKKGLLGLLGVGKWGDAKGRPGVKRTGWD